MLSLLSADGAGDPANVAEGLGDCLRDFDTLGSSSKSPRCLLRLTRSKVGGGMRCFGRSPRSIPPLVSESSAESDAASELAEAGCSALSRLRNFLSVRLMTSRVSSESVSSSSSKLRSKPVLSSTSSLRSSSSEELRPVDSAMVLMVCHRDRPVS